MQIKKICDLKGMLYPVQNGVSDLEGQNKQNFILTKEGLDEQIKFHY